MFGDAVEVAITAIAIQPKWNRPILSAFSAQRLGIEKVTPPMKVKVN